MNQKCQLQSWRDTSKPNTLWILAIEIPHINKSGPPINLIRPWKIVRTFILMLRIIASAWVNNMWMAVPQFQSAMKPFKAVLLREVGRKKKSRSSATHKILVLESYLAVDQMSLRKAISKIIAPNCLEIYRQAKESIEIHLQILQTLEGRRIL